jgi:hypothetical protein
MSKTAESRNAVNLKHELRATATEMQKTAAEVRLKLHLASLDAKSSWAELEPRVHEFKETVERAADDAMGGWSRWRPS